MGECNQSVIEKVVDLATDGLFIDGGHHKQWYLEQILKAILGDAGFQAHMDALADDGYEHLPGIAP